MQQQRPSSRNNIGKGLFLGIAFLLFLLQLQNNFAYAQTNVGYGIKAKKGDGKYRGAVYWLSWGVAPGQELHNGDKAEFKVNSGTTYTVVVSNIKTSTWNSTTKSFGAPIQMDAGMRVNETDDWAGNNSQYFYNFDDNPDQIIDAEGNPHNYVKAIALKAPKHKKCEFTLTVTATDYQGNTVDDINLVIAGTESIANSVEGYGVTVGKDAGINIVEGYKNITTGQWYTDADTAPFDCLLIQEPVTVGGQERKKLTVHNPVSGNCRGDLMFAAMGVHTIDAFVQTNAGGQHFAIGVLDMSDFGDLPSSYEDANNPAMHVSVPDLGEPIQDGMYLFRKQYQGTPIQTIDTYREVVTTIVPNASGQYIINNGDLGPEQPMATLLKPKLRMGDDIDYEISPLYSEHATGDDDDNEDDELSLAEVMVGCAAPKMVVKNALDQDAYLYYWVDKDNSGNFQDSERGQITIPHDAAQQEVAVNITDVYTPSVSENRFVRFRLTSEPMPADHLSTGYQGILPQGEVEDVEMKFLKVTIKDPINSSFVCMDGEPKAPFIFEDLAKSGWKIEQCNGATFDDAAIDATYTQPGHSVDTAIYLPEGTYSFRVSFTVSGCSDVFENKTITNNAPDTDHDGINDVCDMDNDNDGILDTDENACSHNLVQNPSFEADDFTTVGTPNPPYGTYFANPTTQPLNGWKYTHNCNGWIDTDAAIAATQEGHQYVDVLGNDTDNPAGQTNTLYQALSTEAGKTYEFSFYWGEYVENAEAPFLGTTQLTASVKDQTYDGTEITSATLAEAATGDASGIKGPKHWNFYKTTFTATSAKTVITFKAVAYGASGDKKVGAALDMVSVRKQCDADDDGVPNYLDLDSDNDGCPDALEANATLDYGDLDGNGAINISNHPVGSSSDTYPGVPDNEPATGIGTSQDTTQQASACSCSILRSNRNVTRQLIK